MAPGIDIQNSGDHPTNQGVIKTVWLEGALRVYIDIPSPVVHFGKSILVSLRQMRRAAARAIEREEFRAKLDRGHARDRARLEERRRLHGHLGRVAARRVRKGRSTGMERRDLIRDIARENELSYPYMEQLIVAHNRAAKERYNRMRDLAALGMASAGHTNIEIASRFNISPAYAGRIVSSAFANQQTNPEEIGS